VRLDFTQLSLSLSISAGYERVKSIKGDVGGSVGPGGGKYSGRERSSFGIKRSRSPSNLPSTQSND
jgi:hypothetical protein